MLVSFSRSFGCEVRVQIIYNSFVGDVGKGITDQDRNILSNQLLLLGFLRSVEGFLALGPVPREAAVNARKSKKKNGGGDHSESEDEPELESFDDDDDMLEDSSSAHKTTTKSGNPRNGADHFTKRAPIHRLVCTHS